MNKIILQPKITIEFPYIQRVTEDWYEFGKILKEHRNLLGRKDIKYQELGCCGIYRFAVFYIDENELTILDIKKMLAEEGLSDEYIDEVTENLEI